MALTRRPRRGRSIEKDQKLNIDAQDYKTTDFQK